VAAIRAMRAFTSFRTRDAGKGRSGWKRTVPLLVEKPFNSPLKASSTAPGKNEQ